MAKFHAIRAKAGKPETVAVTRATVAPQDALAAGLKIMAAGTGTGRVTTTRNDDGSVTIRTDEVFDRPEYWAWLHEQLVTRAKWVSERVGIDLTNLKPPPKSVKLLTLIDAYAGKPKLSPNEASRSRLFWSEFIKAVDVDDAVIMPVAAVTLNVPPPVPNPQPAPALITAPASLLTVVLPEQDNSQTATVADAGRSASTFDPVSPTSASAKAGLMKQGPSAWDIRLGDESAFVADEVNIRRVALVLSRPRQPVVAHLKASIHRRDGVLVYEPGADGPTWDISFS